MCNVVLNHSLPFTSSYIRSKLLYILDSPDRKDQNSLIMWRWIEHEMQPKSVGWSRISTGSSTVNYVIQGLNPLNQCKSIGSHGIMCHTGKQKYLNSKNHHFNYKMLKVVWKTLPWILQSWENVYLCLICCRNAFITEPKAKHHWNLELLWHFTPLHPLKRALSHMRYICSSVPEHWSAVLGHA